MTKVELAERLAREGGVGILDDVLGVAEEMDTYDITCDWKEMEGLIRDALRAQVEADPGCAPPSVLDTQPINLSGLEAVRRDDS